MPHLLLSDVPSEMVRRGQRRRTLGQAARVTALAIVLSLGFASSAAAEPRGTLTLATGPEFMVRTRVGERLVEGQPLAWSERRVYLLSRDGQLVNFAPAAAHDYHRSARRFVGYPAEEMRLRLREEFGRLLEVTATQHYLVVHPRGQKKQWGERFEQLYRGFVRYFHARGFQLDEPKYPLVAIVFRRQEEYRRYAESESAYLGESMLGHYSPRTNRIALFDATGGNPQSDWSQNAATVIHEATHQTAFNTGVHARMACTPRWVSEGLATMFEACGVWDSAQFPKATDRLNRSRLVAYRRYAEERRRPGALAALVASDGPFRSDPHGAYAEAWALSYYLSERRPRAYRAYLARLAARPAFQTTTPGQRMADFSVSFGTELERLETQFSRYMAEIQ